MKQYKTALIPRNKRMRSRNGRSSYISPSFIMP